MRPLVPVLALTLLLAACGATTATTATPPPSATAPTPAPAAAPVQPSTPRARPTVLPTGAARVALPQRPRAVDVTGVDVCALVTSAQQQELGVAGPVRRHPHVTAAAYGNNPVDVCDVGGLELLLSTKAGIEALTVPPFDGTLRPGRVLGFPAVTAAYAGHTDWCTVAVDLAPHTVLSALSTADGRSQPAICADAQRAAEAATTTLTTTLGR